MHQTVRLPFLRDTIEIELRLDLMLLAWAISQLPVVGDWVDVVLRAFFW